MAARTHRGVKRIVLMNEWGGGLFVKVVTFILSFEDELIRVSKRMNGYQIGHNRFMARFHTTHASIS